VGEVDQLNDPVDERVAQRDQREDRAVRQTLDEVVAQPVEVPVVRQVLDPVDHGQDQQDRDEAVAGDELPDGIRATPGRRCDRCGFQAPSVAILYR
jgi:hypothetical protein